MEGESRHTYTRAETRSYYSFSKLKLVARNEIASRHRTCLLPLLLPTPKCLLDDSGCRQDRRCAMRQPCESRSRRRVQLVIGRVVKTINRRQTMTRVEEDRSSCTGTVTHAHAHTRAPTHRTNTHVKPCKTFAHSPVAPW